MTEKMKHYKKRYDLDIIEEDGKIVSMFLNRSESEKVEMKKDGNNWVAKGKNYIFTLPGI